MPGTDAQVNLSVKLDQQTATQISQFVDQTIDRFSRLDALMKSTSADAHATGASIIDAVSQSKSATDAAVDATDRLAKGYDAAGDAAGRSGDLQISAFRSVGRALDQLGLTSIGRPVQQIGDVGIISKQLGSVNEALEAMGSSATELLAVAGPVALAIGAAAIALSAFNNAIADDKKALESATGAVEKFYDDLAKGVTTAQAKASKENLESNVIPARQAEVDQFQALIDAKVKEYNLGGFTKQEQEAIPGVGAAFQVLYGSLEKAQGQLQDAQNAVGSYTGALENNTLAANDAKAAAKETSDAVDKIVAAYVAGAKGRADAQIKADADEITQQQKITDQISKYTYTQAEDRLAAITDEQEKNRLLISQYEAMNDKTGAAAEAIKKLTDANANLQSEGEQIVSFLDKLPAELAARDQRVAQIQQKYNDDTVAADTKTAQDRAAISKKLNDTLVSDAQKLADTLAQDLVTLQNKQADNLTSLNRDMTAEQVDAQNKSLTIQINAQRKSQQEAQQHADTLAQIQKDANAREVGFLLDRNFLGLLQSRLQTTTDINKENTSYNSKTAQNQRDEQNQLDDLGRSINEQRTARLVAYKNANDDAQTQYERANKAAEDARDLADKRAQQARIDALNALNKQIRDEYNARYKGYVDQLTLQNKFGADYIKAQGDIQNALLKQAHNTLASLNNSISEMAHGSSGGSAMAHSAGGNYLGIGQASAVNDRYPGQRESFNGVMLPGGKGVFYPMQPGYVSPGGGSSQTFIIHSTDPMGVRAEVATILTRFIKP